MEGSRIMSGASWYFMWLPVTCFLTVCLSSVSQGTDLIHVKGVAIDQGYKPENMLARSIYAPFINRNRMWVQLWQPEPSVKVLQYQVPQYRLVWQILIRPQRGNGSLEYINLELSQYVQVFDTYRIGVSNVDMPGPLNANHSSQALLALSINGTVANVSGVLKFDDLFFPYHIPIRFCEDLDCPRIFGPFQKLEPVAFGLLGDGRSLMTDEMIIGLIAWNIVLSIILIIVLLVLVCLCAGMERRKKYKSRNHRDSESEGGAHVRGNPVWGPTDSWRTEQRMSPDSSSDKQHLAQADELSRAPSDRSDAQHNPAADDIHDDDDDQPMQY